MKYLAIIFFLISGAAYAQTDSLQVGLSQLPDTVLDEASLKLDSLEKSFTSKSDSIKQSYSRQKEKLTGLKAAYHNKADSLTKLNLPTTAYTQKIDSVDQRLTALQHITAAKVDSLKSNVSGQINRLKLPKTADSKVSKLTDTIDKVSVPSFDTSIANKTDLNKLNSVLHDTPSLTIPSANPPGTNLPDLNTAVPSTGVNLPDMKGSMPATDINIGKIGDIPGKAGDIQNQVKDVTGSTDGLGKTLESKAGEQVKGLPEQKMPEVPGLQGGVPKTGDEAKEQLAGMAKKEAVNHFAGKEAVVTSAIEKMSKYKQKYSSVSSLKDLKDEKHYNEMKGKPLHDRLVPAITFQFQSWHDLMLDINPSVGYRFTSHILAGLGWNQRIAFNVFERRFNQDARVFGIRSYGEYTFNKGFGFRLDVECMNTPLKQKNIFSDVSPGRDWVWSAMAGVKQRYPIYKRLKGNAQLMYNIFDRDHRSPYTDRVNFRIGLEFTIKKKKTPAPIPADAKTGV